MPGNLQIQGGAFRDAQANVLSNGFLVFKLSHDSLYGSGNAQVVGGIPITVRLDNTGNVSSSTPTFIYSNDVLTPSTTFYTVTAYRSDGSIAWRAPQYWTLASTTNPLDLGTMIPSNPPPPGLANGGSNTSISTNVLNVSSNITISNVTGILYIFATGGVSGITVTYPAAGSNTAATIVTKKVDAGIGVVTVAANLDGNGNYSLTNIDQYVSGASNGSSWFIVANN